jgi:hypothetical protein
VEEIAGNRPANSAGKGNDRAIDSNGLRAGKIFPGVRKPIGGCDRERYAGHSAGEADEQAFRYLFADEGETSRTQRTANGNFFLPSGAACDEKVGDIQTTDQQQAARGGHENEKRVSHVLGEVVDDVSRHHVFGNWGMEILHMKAILQGSHLADGVCQADIGPHSGHNSTEVKVVMLQNKRR